MRGGDHLSRVAVSHHLQQPTRRSRETGRLPCAPKANTFLLLGLALDGGCLAVRSPGAPVGSYPTFSPSPGGPPGSLFLWPYPRVTPPGCYPASCPEESGLSSARARYTKAADPRRDRPVRSYLFPCYHVGGITSRKRAGRPRAFATRPRGLSRQDRYLNRALLRGQTQLESEHCKPPRS
jgi:hypothetical protein